jgi:hypothetical protein
MKAVPPAAALDRVLALVPAHARLRDEEASGLLRALAGAVAADLDVLEQDIAALYESWFVETCPEWVLPYIADLLGIRELPPDLATSIGAPVLGGPAAAGVSRRAYVANTVTYRRRKGTPAAIEQVARDVTGWPARVVEYHGLLAVATYLDLVRTDRPVTASMRTQPDGRLDLVPRRVAQGALDPLAYTPDVRGLASGAGRPGLHRLAVYLFPDQVRTLDPVSARPPAAGGDGAWAVHPLGLDTPLYGPPADQAGHGQLAGEADLPVPLRPRRLLALLQAARQADAANDDKNALDAVLAVTVQAADGEPAAPLTPGQILVYGLERPDTAGDAPWQVLVDPVRGRLYPRHGGAPAAPADLSVRCSVGATAEVGAGPYDRRVVHAAALRGDPYEHDNEDGAAVRGQAAARPAGRCTTALQQALAEAERRLSLLGGTYVVVLPENGRYDGDVSVRIPAGTRLVIVAATWNDGQLGHYDAADRQASVGGGLTVAGGSGSGLLLDGLVIEGDVAVGPGTLGSLTLSQCTLAGDVAVAGDAGGANPGITVRLLRTACLPLRPPAPAGTAAPPGQAAVRFGGVAGSLTLLDSSIDAPAGRPAILGAELAVTADGSTVRGGLTVRTLDASNCLLDGPVAVRHRQAYGLRYCYAPASSRSLRRFRCVPASDAASGAPAPVYAATDPGAPGYLALGPGCAAEIAHGGEGGSEMGVHHHVGRPLRRQAAERLLTDYVPVGLEFGVFAPLPR